MEPQARFSSPLAVLSTCALLALGGIGCGSSSEKIGSVSDPTGAATPKPTTKFSAAGGFVSVGGKAGKGHNGNGNGNGGGGGGGDGGGNGGGGNGGGGNGGGGHDHSGNGHNGGGNASLGIDSNPKTSSRPGNAAGAVDCKSNDSGGSGECASTINCTNVHLPGTQDTQCCPFPIPSDQGGHKRKGSSSGGDCPTDVSGETDTSSESSSGKDGHKKKKGS